MVHFTFLIIPEIKYVFTDVGNLKGNGQQKDQDKLFHLKTFVSIFSSTNNYKKIW